MNTTHAKNLQEENMEYIHYSIRKIYNTYTDKIKPFLYSILFSIFIILAQI